MLGLLLPPRARFAGARQLLVRWREAPLLYFSLFIIRRLPQSRYARQLPPGPQKNTTSFFGDPGGGAKEIDVCRASKITEPSRVSLRFVAAEQISQAASFLAALLRCSLSRAVEPALGQEMARSMCHFQARKWSKPHRGFDKKALSRPLPAKLADTTFSGALSYKSLPRAKPRFCAAGLNLYPQGIHTHRAYIPTGHTYPQGIHTRRAYIPAGHTYHTWHLLFLE